MFYSINEIDRLISEDMPYFDLTTEILKIKNEAKIEFSCRNDTVVSGNMIVKILANRLNLTILDVCEDGKYLIANKALFIARGSASDILALWKIAQNIYQYACGVATYTNEMVKKAKSINPNIEIFTTRKIIPFTKKLALQAIIDGGALPHRITTGETILVFDNYMELYGGWDKFIKKFRAFKDRALEKKWVVEVDTVEMAKKFIDIGVDVLQLERFSTDDTKYIIKEARKHNIKVMSTAGITIDNVEEYVKLGVDAIVTTSPYFANGADIKVKIKKYEKYIHLK